MSTADVNKETRPLLQDSSTTSEQPGRSRQYEINNGSQSTKTEAYLHGVVSKDCIESLSERILKWRDIGRKLKISDEDLDRIQSDTTGGHKERVYQMLKKWTELKGSNATYKKLGEALMKCGRTDLQQRLEQEAKALSRRSIIPTYQSAKALSKESTVPTNQSDYTIEAGGEELHLIEMQKKRTLNYKILVSCVILVVFLLILTVLFVWRASTTADKNPATTITTPLTKSKGTTAKPQTSKKYPYYVNIQDYADEPGRHNLILGSTRPGDIRLYTFRQIKLGTLFEVQKYTFQYSKKPTETISGVLVRDNWDDDTGGYPELMAGGPGQGYVDVKVTSQKSRGFDFSFSVYGRNN